MAGADRGRRARARRLASRLGITAGRARHLAEQLLWDTTWGSRWLLTRDLRVVDEFRRAGRPSPFEGHEWSKFSQNGEDGIIDHLIRVAGIETPGTFVEIGAADGEQNCTRHLAEQGWTGVWLEADPDLCTHARSLPCAERVRVVESFVNADNVVASLRGAGAPTHLDVLVVDIDGHDHSVLSAVLERFTAGLVVTEYNGSDRGRWVLPARRSGGWDRSWNYGASLTALEDLMTVHGYGLVGCDAMGVNAFWTPVGTPGVVHVPAREGYRPPMHHPGGLGHPRRSPLGSAPTPDLSAGVLERVALAGATVVGPSQRRPGETVSLVVELDNGSEVALSSEGDHPVLAVAAVTDAGGRRLDDLVAPRAPLAFLAVPSRRRATGIEVVLPTRPGRYRVVPTLVQEHVVWRELDPAEGVDVEVVPG